MIEVIYIFFQFQEDSQSNTDKDGLDDECSVQGQSIQSDHDFSRPTPSPSPGSSGSKRSAGNGKKDLISNKKVLQLVAERLRKTDDVKVGQHDSFGKHVADELNNMTPEMVPYVKKIINLAIFEGHMKTLNMSSAIVTQQVSGLFPSVQPPQNHFSILQPPQDNFSSAQPMQGQYHVNIVPPETQADHASATQYFSQFCDK